MSGSGSPAQTGFRREGDDRRTSGVVCWSGAVWVLALCACATAAPAARVDAPLVPAGDPVEPPPAAPPLEDEQRGSSFPDSAGPGAPLAAWAQTLVGLDSLRHVSRRVPDDCTGLVRLAYWQASVELLGTEGEHGDNGVMAIFRHAEALGALHFRRPAPGDLVFFRETYDRDRNGRFDDGLTHVGLVTKVEPDGTVVFVHRIGSGVSEGRLNPEDPSHHEDGGRVLNDWLRPASARVRAGLTGELFSGYASAERLLRAGRAFGRR